MSKLNITILEKEPGKDMSINVGFGSDYTQIFGETPFYQYWTQNTNGNLFFINIGINSKNLYLHIFEFSPKRLYLPYDQQYVYDLMTSDEKDYFRGMGHKILCSMLLHGKSLGYYSDNTVVKVQPSDLYYGDSIREESIPDLDPITATDNFKGLVRYYHRLGFNLTEPINWNDPKYKIQPKISTCMQSSVGNLLSKCM